MFSKTHLSISGITREITTWHVGIGLESINVNENCIFVGGTILDAKEIPGAAYNIVRFFSSGNSMSLVTITIHKDMISVNYDNGFTLLLLAIDAHLQRSCVPPITYAHIRIFEMTLFLF